MSKVKLRRKPISGGRSCLFLDIYPPVPHPQTGKLVRKHYLELYTFDKPKNNIERNHNIQTMELAEHVRAKRQIDVQNFKYDFVSQEMMRGNFVDFFDGLREKRSGSNLANWNSAINYFKLFAGEKVTYMQLNETFAEEYADFLQSSPSLKLHGRKIKKNSAVSYFAKFRYALKQAFKKRLLYFDLASIIDPISPADTHREFLFLDELKRLANTPCSSDVVKRASLFSVMTGLRFSDVETLEWPEVRGVLGDYRIHFSQEKTRSAEYLPIPDQAYALLGEPGEGVVFKGLRYYDVDRILPMWIREAGIFRHITFHCFRHTFATLQLFFGTDLVVVSKMLGHKDIKTTMIYVKIVDQLKRDASDRMSIQIGADWIKLPAA